MIYLLPSAVSSVAIPCPQVLLEAYRGVLQTCVYYSTKAELCDRLFVSLSVILFVCEKGNLRMRSQM